MSKLTDKDNKFGPFTWGRSSWNPLRIVLSSGGGDDDGATRNTLTVYAFGWCARLNLPNLIKPHRVKHVASSWDAETVARMGRNWYFETFPRDYGFSLHDGFLQVFFGAQTHDSSTTQDWCKHLPWTQWRFVRQSLYDAQGKHFWTELAGASRRNPSAWEEHSRMVAAAPKVSFAFDDFDGKRLTASTHIEEWEWKFGEGWFKWLSIFRSPKVRRCLYIQFSDEVGPEKGSWKGGTVGTQIEMLPGEMHEAAFRRYCGNEHRAKYRNYQIRFIGVAAAA